MEQRIIELSSQREFYRATNHRLQHILEVNNGTATLNGSNPTGGHFQSIAGVTPGNKPSVASLPTAVDPHGGEDLQDVDQQGGAPSFSGQLGTAGGGMMAPQRLSDMPSSNLVQSDTQAGSTPARWTLSGWKQGAFEPQSGLTPLTEASAPKTTA